MTNKNDLKKLLVFVNEASEKLRCVNSDGEVIFTRAYPMGEHTIHNLVPLMGENDQIEFGPNMEVFEKPSRVQRTGYGDGANDSGANPDFMVTSATRNARETERTLRMLQLKTATLDRRMAALGNLTKAHEKAVDKILPSSTDDVQLIDPDDNQTPTEEEAPKKGNENVETV